MGEGEHARTQGVTGAVFGAREAELGEGVETAADGGAGESSFDAELGDGHLRRLLGEGLDDDESARERGHEVWVTGVDVKRRGRGGLGSGCDGRGKGGGEGLAGREVHCGLPFRAGSEWVFDRRPINTINAHVGCRKGGATEGFMRGERMRRSAGIFVGSFGDRYISSGMLRQTMACGDRNQTQEHR